ncbi:MAG: SurA N-terminal domain-containing protein [Rhodocyclaceae bacterium]|nr:SurA N-terminal domain-containing protein [Rhodocyclaceae bacterium]
MFDAVRNNRRIVQIFLALITLPFALWGVDSYISNASSGNDVAVVDGAKISTQEFLRALQAQQERLRAAAGRDIPAAALDTPEVRLAVAEGLVNQKLLTTYAHKSRLGIGDRQLAEFITSIPDLQENGQFSRDRYEALVAAQGMSQEGFEYRLRQDMLNRQVSLAVSQASLASRTASQQWAGLQLEEREIAEFLLKPDAYVAQVKLAPDAAKKFYEANRKVFEVPEQVKAEFLILSRQALSAQAEITEEEIKSWYAAHAEQFKQAEERRASHILIAAAKDAPEETVKAARAKADEILARLRKDPKAFADLAKQHSQDPVSAAKGGDLDWFGRGLMVKPFDDAVFALKEGETSEIVRSDFGFHIVRLTGVRSEKVKALDEVRSEIVAALREQAGQRKFAELSEAFSNIVYEQSDSLTPAAEKLHLQIQQSDWISKDRPAAGALANPKVLAALFSDDAIKNHRNTESVEIAPGTLLAARVVQHKEASLKPLEELQAEIEKRLLREEASKLAAAAGEERLAALRKDDASIRIEWSAARMVPRLGAQGIAPQALKAVFSASGVRLPAYTGVSLPDGSYALYRVQQVKRYAAQSEADEKAAYMRQQYAGLIANEEFAALLATLHQRFTVEINRKVLEAKER